MQRFFVEPYQIEEETHRIHINGTDVNHIKNVLRMKCGEDVWISDGGNKEYHCQIEELREDEVLLHILYAQEPEYELPNKIYLYSEGSGAGSFLSDSCRDKAMCSEAGCEESGEEGSPLAANRRERGKTVKANADPRDSRSYDL